MAARVVLAMSGGVDSSAAAHLLLEQGYEVIGLFMRSGATDEQPAACNLDSDNLLPVISAKSHKQGCCSASDAADARRVADMLDIPFHALNFADAFGRIKDYFADEYLAGRTPNPCVMCNNWLKFGKLWDFARQVGAEHIATGHYAQLRAAPGESRPALVRGLDAGKDQSYVLFGIERNLLDRVLFPVGGYTKAQIRDQAERAGLRVFDKPDSQEICFIPDNDYAGFLERYRGEQETSGELVDTAGNVVGEHDGFERFTVGQRRGLGVTFGAPRFVVAIEPETKRVVIGEKEDLARHRLEADRLNWLVESIPKRFECHAMIRYRHTPARAEAQLLGDDLLQVEFAEPQYGVAPGQAVVLYDGDRVLGGGWIGEGRMLGSTLALLSRSLKQDSRLLFPHLMRLGLLGFAMWLLIMAHEESRSRGAPGLLFFQYVTWLNFVFISIAGVGIFSSAITEEKEERTIGLLRMAGVSPVSLLLGKSLPRLTNAVLLLSLQFPFTLLAIALGGVTIHQVEAAYCSLLAFMLALGNVALLSSVVCRTSHRAAWLTGILLVLYLAGPVVMFGIVGLIHWTGFGHSGNELEWITDSVTDLHRSVSIWNRIDQIMTTGFSDSIFGTQVIFSLVVAAIAFGMAWGLAGRFLRDDETEGAGVRFTFRSKGRLRQFPVGRAWLNALAWKDFYFVAGGLVWMLVKFILYGLALLGFAAYIYSEFNFTGRRGSFSSARVDIGHMIISCSALVLAGEGAFYASRVFRDELRGKTHASLMMLPYSTARVAYAKVGGCLLGLLPVLFYVVLGFFVVPEAIEDVLDVVSEPGAWWFVAMYLLFLHLTAFLSLLIRWGALPLALGTIVLANGCCLTPLAFGGAGPSSSGGFFVMLAFLAVVACGFLKAATGEMLRTRAAE